MEIYMKERPILFSAPMVRAILDGRKTQTRRAAKVSRVDSHPDQPLWKIVTLENGRQGWLNAQAEHPHHITSLCPYGQPGDRLWVRESWAYHPDFPESARRVIHRAERGVEHDVDRWRPSIHMPRWACRILLEITAVRVERLQDISDDDLSAEGIQEIIDAGVDHDGWPRDAYRALWESINGPGSWDANPWVWVIEFSRI